MVKENNHYRQVVKITDESFDPQQLHAYNLYISYGRDRVRVGVVDTDRNKFISLEDYQVSHIYTPLQGAQVFNEVFSGHPYVFSPDWHQIKLAVNNHNFTFIPDTLFEADAAADYLSLNCDFDADHEKIFTYKHTSIEAVNIFSADKYLTQIWERQLPGKELKYLHLTCPLIASLLHYGERTSEKRLYAYVQNKSLCLLIMQEGKLEFCNLFQCSTPEDFLYFFVLVMQEQKLNPEHDRVTLWGDLEHDSALFTLLRSYIRNVQFGSRPPDVSYSYKIEDLFQHHYLDVFGMHFC
ncbi:hypothetical protein AAE02nite_22380 [Adhaeribacter aerolatus]|uniref:DUF3822 domain-containing protein n=1 Tax=Adhaeribacter aerolatus TaxID=670289 RepID=A0A512AXZ0_9BACT|nr:DUF3822 family protein [Adhaeribacter aerolatus]GEO04574.1 hypothetical protein AAE02nite_22380 [Adhaeribacter aerolatus]